MSRQPPENALKFEHAYEVGKVRNQGKRARHDDDSLQEEAVHIIYDYRRTGDRHILTASFREETTAAGKLVTGDVHLRQFVSEASGGLENRNAASTPGRDYEAVRPRIRRQPLHALPETVWSRGCHRNR